MKSFNNLPIITCLKWLGFERSTGEKISHASLDNIELNAQVLQVWSTALSQQESTFKNISNTCSEKILLILTPELRNGPTSRSCPGVLPPLVCRNQSRCSLILCPRLVLGCPERLAHRRAPRSSVDGMRKQASQGFAWPCGIVVHHISRVV